MAPVSTTEEVRQFGRLPEAEHLPAPEMQPHLDAAARELVRWVGDYSAATGDKLESCKEAEMCICIAYLIPVVNTLFTEANLYAQREIGESGFLFHSPGEKNKVVDGWWERARTAVSEWSGTAGTKKSISFYAV
jgi:hypothetical protein